MGERTQMVETATGTMEGNPDPEAAGAPAGDWASLIPMSFIVPTIIPSSISEAGGVAVSKGLGLMTSRTGPWSEFISCRFSKPEGISDAKNRITQGGTRFLGNYGLVTCTFASLFVLGHPLILICLGGLGAIWTYLLRRTEPVELMGMVLSERQLYVLMSIVSFASFTILGALQVMVNGLFWGASGSVVHAVFHEKSNEPLYDPLATEISGDFSGELSEVNLQDMSVDVEQGATV